MTTSTRLTAHRFVCAREPRPQALTARCRTAALLVALTTSAAVGCSHEPQAVAAAASATAAVAPLAETAAASATADPTAMPHGDHNPKHGGVVFMNGDMHFEVVLGRNGRHQVYFSDAVRAELPAAVAKDLVITVTRAGRAPEAITARIDETGESWIAEGDPVGNGDASARIAYTAATGPYFLDTPFMPPAP